MEIQQTEAPFPAFRCFIIQEHTFTHLLQNNALIVNLCRIIVY